MEVTARLPLLFRGSPVRNNGDRYILVSRDLRWDVPEVSASETETAFEAREAWRLNWESSWADRSRSTATGKLDRVFSLIGFNGGLYRRVAVPGDGPASAFEKAFPSGYLYTVLNAERDISVAVPRFEALTDQSPASEAVLRQLLWQMKCGYAGDRLSAVTWPHPPVATDDPVGTKGPFYGRNYARYEDLARKITAHDGDDFARCLRMHEVHMSGFLIVDGDLWARTRPPVYRVRRDGKAYVTVDMTCAPSWHDVDLNTFYFRLDAPEEALDFARLLSRTLEIPAVRDLTVPFAMQDELLHLWDVEAEEIRRASCAMSAEARRFYARSARAADGADPGFLEGMEKSFEEVRRTDYVVGEYGDPSPWFDGNVQLWKSARRPASIYDLGLKETSDLVIERARRYIDDRPIMLDMPTPHASEVRP